MANTWADIEDGALATPDLFNDRFNALRKGDVHNVKAYGAVGDGVADDAGAIQEAVTAAAASGGIVLVPAGRYAMSSAVTLDNNVAVEFARGATVTMTTRLDYLFTAANKTGILIRGPGKILGTNTSHANTVTERLLYFVDCEDVTVEGVELGQTIIGCQFESCVGWSFIGNTVRDILPRTDNSQGYGILANLDNRRFAVAFNHYDTIGRHAIYLSSGTSLGVAHGNTIEACDGAAISVFATSAQNPSKEITISNNIIRTVGNGVMVSPRGINLTQNVQDIKVFGNTIISTEQYGIAVEGSATNTADQNPRGITVQGNTVRSAGSHGIWLTNVADAIVAGNLVKSPTLTGIVVTTNGSDVGSVTSRVQVYGNQVDDAGDDGINMSGSLADCSLGPNLITNPASAKYNIPSTVTGVRYDLPGMFTVTFYHAALAAGATDSDLSASTVSAFWRMPVDCYLLDLSFTLNGSITAPANPTVALTFDVTRDGNTVAGTSTTFLAGETEKNTSFQLGQVLFPAGQNLGIEYTSDPGLTPNGTRGVTVVARLVPA